MADADKIKAALALLDPTNDKHWTDDGLPQISFIAGFVKAQVKREEIIAADPELTRAKLAERIAAAIAKADEEAAAAAAKPPEPAVQVQDAVQPAQGGQQESQPEANTDDELDALEAAVAAADKDVAEATAAAHAAQKKLEAANAARDKVVAAREKARPKDENQLGIQAYLARQNEVRAQKAGVAADLKGLGVRLKDMQPKSPIDQAMARKNSRGTQRPTLPLR